MEGEMKTYFDFEKPVIVSGKTIPNGIVTLYIFSDPRTASVTADGEGNWSYAIENLEPGEHRVEAEVKDSVSGLLSDRSILARFNVNEAIQAAQATSSQTVKATKSKNYLVWTAIVCTITLLFIGSLLFLRIRHKDRSINRNTATTGLPESPSPESTSNS